MEQFIDTPSFRLLRKHIYGSATRRLLLSLVDKSGQRRRDETYATRAGQIASGLVKGGEAAGAFAYLAASPIIPRFSLSAIDAVNAKQEALHERAAMLEAYSGNVGANKDFAGWVTARQSKIFWQPQAIERTSGVLRHSSKQVRTGYLACVLVGFQRMTDPEEIVDLATYKQGRNAVTHFAFLAEDLQEDAMADLLRIELRGSKHPNDPQRTGPVRKLQR